MIWGTKGQALKKLDSWVVMETAQQQVGGIFSTEIQMRNVTHSYFRPNPFFRGETHTKRLYLSYNYLDLYTCVYADACFVNQYINYAYSEAAKLNLNKS